ncbi:hypothetical protein [Ferrimonas sp. YFM]|uniref:hypothetical protein n=1 Tax=Ferrimonas sp. YFM TaxID=3028878 RepID=UPI0025743229|nr:hypothetical protein [Ferrimonas sp. YFM]BDY05752.1 hypothetical protein F0521_27930 [Ferrimonas sp. YFM]
MTHLEDVFGVSGKHIKSYIEREHVDAKLLDALRTDKQVVVYGASKQGKTALVSKYVKYEENIVVSLSPKFTMEDIYKSMLREAGVSVRTSFTEGTGRETRTGIKAQIQATIAMFGKAGVSSDISEKSQRSRTDEYEEIEFNLALPNDVASLIHRAGCKKVVILENFHYLNENMQRQFAYDLRAFQDLKVKIVILGVWKEANRMSQFNGDLQDRIVEVPVEPWSKDDFVAIAKKGEPELNVSISERVVQKCIDSSFNSVGVYQELLKGTVRFSGVTEKQHGLTVIDDLHCVELAISDKTEYYSGRHLRNLEAIAAGTGSKIQSETPLPFFMPYYIVIALLGLGFEGINGGVSKDTLMQKIRVIHHRSGDLKGAQLTSALKKLGELQSSKGINPPVLAYDSNTRMLKVIDSTFYFYLKYANLDDASDDIVNPVDCIEC